MRRIDYLEKAVLRLKTELEIQESISRSFRGEIMRYITLNFSPKYKIGDKVSLFIPSDTRYVSGYGLFSGGHDEYTPSRTLLVTVIDVEVCPNEFPYYKVVDASGEIHNTSEHNLSPIPPSTDA